MKQTGNLPDIAALWSSIQASTDSAERTSAPTPLVTQEILAFLEELQEPMNEVIRLRYFAQLGVPAIALTLHCSKRAARNYHDKGLHRLRKRFNQAYKERLNTIKKSALVAPCK
jgi:DNA-directed RNA polymerase specialized sigma24 family protein